MEGIKKREKTLFYIFIKQVAIMAAIVVAELILLLVLFSIGLNMEIILPANYTENYLLNNARQIAQSHPFSKELLPKNCEYGLFDQEGNYIEGNTENIDTFADVLTGKKYRNDYKVIERKDGFCVIHYSVQAHFADPFWNKIIPHPEMTAVLVFVMFFLVTVAISAFLFGKKLRKKLTPLLLEIESIKERDLLFVSEKSDIREFNEVLSALHEMKKELEDSLKREWETEQRRKDNISALAHDIKTPVTIIKGNAELLQEETDIEQIYHYAEVINANTDRIDHYIRLLINEAKGVEEHTDAELTQLFAEIKEQSRTLCHTKNVPLRIDENVCGYFTQQIQDAERVVRAVMNIVSNAVEYTDPEKGVVLSLMAENERIVIKVEDYGTGFSIEALRHATEQFYTEKKERSSAHYGLGLYFAKTVAKEHCGNLILANKIDGSGAEVSIII